MDGEATALAHTLNEGQDSSGTTSVQAKSTCRVKQASAAATGRPLIVVKAGELSKIASLAEQALIEAGVPFYEGSNNRLVRPIVKTTDTFGAG